MHLYVCVGRGGKYLHTSLCMTRPPFGSGRDRVSASDAFTCHNSLTKAHRRSLTGLVTAAAACILTSEYLPWHNASPWLTGGAGAVQTGRQPGAVEGPEEEGGEAKAGHGGQDSIFTARHKGVSRVLAASTWNSVQRCRPDHLSGFAEAYQRAQRFQRSDQPLTLRSS